MIARKEAKRLIDELLSAVDEAAEHAVQDWDVVHAERDRILAESDLVLRGAENVEQKGRRYLTEGRLTVLKSDPRSGLVIAECRGTDATYKLGFDPRRREWRCTCPGPKSRKCSHLVALRLVVRPTVNEGSENG